MGNLLSLCCFDQDTASFPDTFDSNNIIRLPLTYQVIRFSAYPWMVCTHGLGSRDPSSTNHANDKALSDIIISGAKLSQMSYVSYTARGHGESTGWEDTAQSNPEQFQWKYLSNDMNAVSNYIGVRSYIAAGNSMGSATALYAALNHPSKIEGVILLQPPTAWETRLERKEKLLLNADACEQANPGQAYHHVLRGSAYSDLPSEDDRSFYCKIKCPVLILAIKGDPVHPLSTSYKLWRLLPTATLHVVNDFDTANKQWPHIIRNFCAEINRRYSSTDRIAGKAANKKNRTVVSSSPRMGRIGMAI